jgi:hypothetical protein
MDSCPVLTLIALGHFLAIVLEGSGSLPTEEI